MYPKQTLKHNSLSFATLIFFLIQQVNANTAMVKQVQSLIAVQKEEMKERKDEIKNLTLTTASGLQ